MKIKEVGNMIMPPIWREFSQVRRESRRRRKPLWDGVYEHYRDVPSTGPGFDGDFWVEETRRMTENLLALDSVRDFPDGVLGDHQLLSPTVVSLMSEGRSASVLDFGGGMGVSYVTLRRSLPNDFSLRYKIVECARVCQIGSELFPDDENITFCESLPDSPGKIDLVYLCCVLQYIEEYAGLLQRLTEYQPQAILLAKTSAGDVPTYATAQLNVPGSAIPYWVLNIEEVIGILAAAGYRLGCHGVLPRVYCQDNFPQRYRFGQNRNLLFLKQ